MLGPMGGATLDLSQKAEKSIGLPRLKISKAATARTTKRLVKEFSHVPLTLLNQSQVQKSCVIFYGPSTSPKKFHNYNLSHGT